MQNGLKSREQKSDHDESGRASRQSEPIILGNSGKTASQYAYQQRQISPVVHEMIYIQLMLLLANNDLKSCEYNCSLLYNNMLKFMNKKDQHYHHDHVKADGASHNKLSKQEIFFFVNLSFIYVKVLLEKDEADP